MEIAPPFKVFISTPEDYWLTAKQTAMKSSLVDRLRKDGFDVQIMGNAGMPYTQEGVWNFDRAQKILHCCQGIVVFGMPRWHDANGIHNDEIFRRQLITEYSHIEGALAFTQNLPVLVLLEEGLEERGILNPSENTLIYIPRLADETFLGSNPTFNSAYERWSTKVKERYHLFFGYSGGAKATAEKILTGLRGKGIRILDWQDFHTSGTIIEEIQRADQTSLGGIFLFTNDDKLTSKSKTFKVPRDNVVFEAGYFMRSKGEKRVALIVENGTKLLDDVGGQIYIRLDNRDDTADAENRIIKFVEDRVSSIS